MLLLRREVRVRERRRRLKAPPLDYTGIITTT